MHRHLAGWSLLAFAAVTAAVFSTVSSEAADSTKPKTGVDGKGQFTVTLNDFTITMLKPVLFGDDEDTPMRRVSILQTYKAPQQAKDENGQPTAKTYNRKVTLVFFKCDTDTAFVSHMILVSPDDKLVEKHMDIDKLMRLEAGSPLALVKQKACAMRPPTTLGHQA